MAPNPSFFTVMPVFPNGIVFTVNSPYKVFSMQKLNRRADRREISGVLRKKLMAEN
jgi:hypothetical protein